MSVSVHVVWPIFRRILQSLPGSPTFCSSMSLRMKRNLPSTSSSLLPLCCPVFSCARLSRAARALRRCLSAGSSGSARTGTGRCLHCGAWSWTFPGLDHRRILQRSCRCGQAAGQTLFPADGAADCLPPWHRHRFCAGASGRRARRDGPDCASRNPWPRVWCATSSAGRGIFRMPSSRRTLLCRPSPPASPSGPLPPCCPVSRTARARSADRTVSTPRRCGRWGESTSRRCAVSWPCVSWRQWLLQECPATPPACALCCAPCLRRAGFRAATSSLRSSWTACGTHSRLPPRQLCSNRSCPCPKGRSRARCLSGRRSSGTCLWCGAWWLTLPCAPPWWCRVRRFWLWKGCLSRTWDRRPGCTPWTRWVLACGCGPRGLFAPRAVSGCRSRLRGSFATCAFLWIYHSHSFSRLSLCQAIQVPFFVTAGCCSCRAVPACALARQLTDSISQSPAPASQSSAWAWCSQSWDPCTSFWVQPGFSHRIWIPIIFGSVLCEEFTSKLT